MHVFCVVVRNDKYGFGPLGIRLSMLNAYRLSAREGLIRILIEDYQGWSYRQFVEIATIEFRDN